jgi:hypothetical protein
VISEDKAVVVPGEGALKDTAALLLELAGPNGVHLVRTVQGGTAFEVPVELAEQFHTLIQPRSKTRRGRGRAAEKE